MPAPELLEQLQKHQLHIYRHARGSNVSLCLTMRILACGKT